MFITKINGLTPEINLSIFYLFSFFSATRGHFIKKVIECPPILLMILKDYIREHIAPIVIILGLGPHRFESSLKLSC